MQSGKHKNLFQVSTHTTTCSSFYFSWWIRDRFYQGMLQELVREKLVQAAVRFCPTPLGIIPSNCVMTSQNGLKALQTTSPGLCVDKYENSFYIAYLQGTSRYICLSINEGLQNSSVWESSAQVFGKLITLVRISKAKAHQQQQSEWEKWNKNPATLLPENHPYQNKCMLFTFTLWLIKWHFCSKTVQKISLPQAESIHLMRTTGEATF